MDNDELPPKKMVTLHLSKPKLKRTKSLAQLSPRNDFTHIMSLIENKDSIITPRRINPLTVKMQDQNKNTALHKAACAGNHAIIKSLIMHNANTNQKNNDGNTPLHLATLHNHTRFVQILVQLGPKKPNLDSQNNNGDTALHIAVQEENIDIIKHLLRAHANPHIKNKQSKTAKDIAKKKKSVLKKIMFMFEGATLKTYLKKYNQKKELFALLLEAVQASKIKDVKKYIKKIEIHWSDKSGNTALHLAASLKQYKIIEFLLKHNADPNQTNKMGDTALHKLFASPPSDKAESKEYIKILKLFLNCGAHLNAQNNVGMTALKLAQTSKNKQIINFIKQNITLYQKKSKLKNTP